MFNITNPSDQLTDILHFDLMTFCPFIQNNIGQTVYIAQSRLYRTNNFKFKSYKEYYSYHEILFGNLYQRTVQIRYANWFIENKMHIGAVAEQIQIDVKHELLNSNHIPILKEFQSESQLFEQFKQQQLWYINNLTNKQAGYMPQSTIPLSIKTNTYSIVQPIIKTTFVSVHGIEYFKMQPMFTTNFVNYFYSTDVILLLKHLAQKQAQNKIKYLRIIDFYNKNVFMINLKRYSSLYSNDKLHNDIYQTITTDNSYDFKDTYLKHNIHQWHNQCFNCTMQFICYTQNTNNLVYLLQNQSIKGGQLDVKKEI